MAEEEKLYQLYVERVALEKNVTFVGCLATYRYLDMDVTVAEALKTARDFILSCRAAA